MLVNDSICGIKLRNDAHKRYKLYQKSEVRKKLFLFEQNEMRQYIYPTRCYMHGHFTQLLGSCNSRHSWVSVVIVTYHNIVSYWRYWYSWPSLKWSELDIMCYNHLFLSLTYRLTILTDLFPDFLVCLTNLLILFCVNYIDLHSHSI